MDSFFPLVLKQPLEYSHEVEKDNKVSTMKRNDDGVSTFQTADSEGLSAHDTVL